MSEVRQLLRRLLGEPTIHFFVLGALLFLAQRLVVGDPRVIVVSAGLRADLERRFRDQTGRAPTAAELTVGLDAWKRDEALYREALREGLDRDDPAVRLVLADKMRARAVQEMPSREPTEPELKQILTQHRDAYESPRRYDFESVAFPKRETTADQQRASYQRALADGAKPATLGRPILSGTLTREDLASQLGPAVAARIPELPVGTWQALDNEDNLLLVRRNRTEGGLPDWEMLRPRLASDWETAMKRQAVERKTQEILDRYHIEERP